MSAKAVNGLTRSRIGSATSSSRVTGPRQVSCPAVTSMVFGMRPPNIALWVRGRSTTTVVRCRWIMSATCPQKKLKKWDRSVATACTLQECNLAGVQGDRITLVWRTISSRALS